jgi:hypothetical protein
MNHLKSSITGLTALVAGLMAQPTGAGLIRMGDNAGGIAPLGNYVVVPFEAENNDSGTEYVNFDFNALALLGF